VRTIGTAPGGGAGNPLLPAISDGFIIAVLVMVIGHVRYSSISIVFLGEEICGNRVPVDIKLFFYQ